MGRAAGQIQLSEHGLRILRPRTPTNTLAQHTQSRLAAPICLRAGPSLPQLRRSFLRLRRRGLEPSTFWSENCRGPATRLRNGNNMQDEKHRYTESRDVAHGKHFHG